MRLRHVQASGGTPGAGYLQEDSIVPSDCLLSVPRPLKGSIDDLRVYNRALSASQIQRFYNMGAVALQVN